MVVASAARAMMVVGEKAEGWLGLGKQDFISHEKCREEQESEVDAADMDAAAAAAAVEVARCLTNGSQ